MRHVIRRIGLAATGMALSLSSSMSTAWAESGRGELGEQSRASIRISVSVAPAFNKTVQPGAPATSEGISLRAVDPSLRYALVTEPLRPVSADDRNRGHPKDGRLILVVPD